MYTLHKGDDDDDNNNNNQINASCAAENMQFVGLL